MQGADGSRTEHRQAGQGGRRSAAGDRGADLDRCDGTPGRRRTESPTAGSARRAPWTDIADYPNTVDGQPGASTSTASRTRSPVATDRPRPPTCVRLRPGHPGLDGEGSAARRPQRGRRRRHRRQGRASPVAGPTPGPSPSTWVYDPAGDAWTAAADAPVSLSASGQAVAGGKLYVVGGCTTGCVHADVERRGGVRPGDRLLGELADYPSAVAFASCGGIDGKVYCTGGNGGCGRHQGERTSTTRAPTPGRRSPTLRSTPGRRRTRVGQRHPRGQRRRPGRGRSPTGRSPTTRPRARGPTCRTPTPLATAAAWRAASTRSADRWAASPPRSTARPCPASRTAARPRPTWAGSRSTPTTATLAPGQSVQVHVTMDPAVAQPGAYSASIAIGDDAPGSVDAVDVTMTVTPPAAWGSSRARSPASPAPAPPARWRRPRCRWTRGPGRGRSTRTPTASYAYWFNAGANPLTLIAAKDGYQPQAKTVQVIRGTRSRPTSP